MIDGGDGAAAVPAAAAAAPTPAEEASKLETAPEVEAPAAPQAAATPAAAPSASGEPVKASPMARAIARDQGIDLSTVTGSGPAVGWSRPMSRPWRPVAAAAQPATDDDDEEIPAHQHAQDGRAAAGREHAIGPPTST